VNITFKLLFKPRGREVDKEESGSPNCDLINPRNYTHVEAMGVRKNLCAVGERLSEGCGMGLRSAMAWIASKHDKRNLREAGRSTGVSVIVYDQKGAAEKKAPRCDTRKMVGTDKRLVINERFAKGCGRLREAVEIA